MKFGLVKHEGRDLQENEQLLINVGNYMQWIAIDHLYDYMDIDRSKVVELTTAQLKTYRGEKIILPINYMMTDTSICAYTTDDYRFIFSEDIVPVFLGISIKKGFWEWTDERIEYFKKYEPIGCRDYLTYQIMKEKGINAYLSGCITATLPLDEARGMGENKGDTVFFVEAPKSLEEFIPNEFFDHCEFVQQEIRISEDDFYDESFGINYTKHLLDKYRTRAKLVVTSRLHCAIPCMALGIPVILVKEYFGYPFDLQKKFLPFYSYSCFDKINWYPERTELEDYKHIALECAKKRVLNLDATNEIAKLHSEYSSLYENGYVEEQLDLSRFKKTISNMYAKDKVFSYAIWGVGKYAEEIYEFMNENFLNARLVHVIDTFKKEYFHGLLTEQPEIFKKNDDYITIVSTINCAAAANVFFDRLKKPANEYMCVADGILSEKRKGEIE